MEKYLIEHALLNQKDPKDSSGLLIGSKEK